jgi:hypothetical protein
MALAILLLVGIALVSVPVNADPNTSSSMQRLPTRQKPTATKKPDKPSRPSSPTNTPVPPPTATPTNTLVPTATRPPTSTPTPTATPTATFTPTPTPIAIPAVGSQENLLLPAEGRIEVKFGQLAPGTQVLNRENLEAHYTLSIPGNLQVLSTDTYVDLVASPIPQDAAQDAVLEVEINERLLPTVALSGENDSGGQTHVELPATFLQPGSNEIVVRLQSDALCEDSGAVLTVQVDERSILSFSYRQDSYTVDLARYPMPFAEESLLRIPITLVLPDEPTAGDLSAAMTLAAGLGQASEGEVDLRTVSAGDFDSDVHGTHHLIVIGLPDTNALLKALDPAPAIVGATIRARQGFLELMVSPWNDYRLLLIASGADDEGILNAIHTLNLDDRFPPIRGASAVIPGFRPPSSQPETTPPQNVSFKSLGSPDETIYGARPQKRTYDFWLPPGWESTAPPNFTLRFSHSNILDPEQSVIDVSLNDQPVGSVFLDDENRTDGEWTIALPQRALQAGNNRLSIKIEMTLPDTDDAGKCRLLDDDRLWTVISGESQLSLPYAIVDFRPYLDHLPYPYSQRSGLDQTVFVLPDQPDTALLSDVLRLGTKFGTLADVDYLPVHVTYASQIDQSLWQDAHLVLVGRATENALLRELNPYLPRPFAVGSSSGGDQPEESDVLAPVASDASEPSTAAAFQLDPDRDTGVLQTVRSPWNQTKALLAIAGTTDKGVRFAFRALLESNPELEGNIAIIDLVSPDSDLLGGYATDTRPADVRSTAGPPYEPSENGRKLGANAKLLAQRWWK